jgi:hypothetical protein
MHWQCGAAAYCTSKYDKGVTKRDKKRTKRVPKTRIAKLSLDQAALLWAEVMSVRMQSEQALQYVKRMKIAPKVLISETAWD